MRYQTVLQTQCVCVCVSMHVSFSYVQGARKVLEVTEWLTHAYAH